MNHILVITKKELRSYFLSPVALIFLSVFLIATFALFFRVEDNIFVRNLVDVRPLFRSLPLLLIFLVSAITMKQWSEEQKLGTLEILLTLPLKTHHLVIGKFLGGWILCILALILTISLPITVSQLGDLDWGPVFGGYIGAILLAGAYLAIGLCVSARTDNQIVALMLTLVVGGSIYLLGDTTITSMVSPDAAETLRRIGTGSRFESIERGLLDLRDLAYFVSLTVFFLSLNVLFLELKRMDSQPKNALSKRRQHTVTLVLIGCNALLLNVWLTPLSKARIDLTQNDEYTINQATKEVLAELDEPLDIQFLFTAKTHEKLKPLIPQVKDMLKEYAVIGGDKVNVSFADPFLDKTLEGTLTDLYNIKSEPLPITDQNSRGVANVYFHILLRYGDQFDVLSFRELVEAHAEGGGVRVRLRNLEYDLTSSIRQLAQGFQSIDSLLSKDNQPTKVSFFISKATYPEAIKTIPESVDKAIEALTKRTSGRIQFEVIDPSQDEVVQAELLQRYGFQGMALGMFTEGEFWSYIVVERNQRMIPAPLLPEFILRQLDTESSGEITGGDIQALIESLIKRLSPSFKKTIGIISRTAGPAQPSYLGAPPPAQGADYTELERSLSANFNVERVELGKGTIPKDIDVLIIGKTDSLDPKAWFAIDQYLMLGGAIIAFGGSFEAEGGPSGWQVRPSDEGLLDLLKNYGVTIRPQLAMDTQNFDLPFPVEERRGDYIIRRIEELDYPYFPLVTNTGFEEANLAFKGVKDLIFPWASPVWLSNKTDDQGRDLLDDRGLPIIDLPEGLSGGYLAWTSANGWIDSSTDIAPDLSKSKEDWFTKADAQQQRRVPLAAAIQGRFSSAFANKPNPNLPPEMQQQAGSDGDALGRTIKHSTPDARLIVLGSTEMLSDKGYAFPYHATFIQNLIDWSLEDTQLLSIRSAGAFAKTLKETEPHERSQLEWMNYAIAVALVGLVFGAIFTRRNLTSSIVEHKEEAA